MTSITTAGTYRAGDYILTSDISVSAANGLVFKGNAKVDLNGKTLACTGNGNAITTGIYCSATLILYDSSAGSGKITGFRCGVKADGVGSSVTAIDLSGNAYMGVWLSGAEGKVTGCLIADIGGVTDEPYAIGVQVNGDGAVVRRCVLRDLYRQAGYVGEAAGEGVGVNLTTDTSGGTVTDCLFDNAEPAVKTYGVWAGGASNRISKNRFRNFWRGVAMSNLGSSEVRHNVVILESALAGSIGIGCQAKNPEAVAHNIVVGYALAYYGDTLVETNVALDFEEFPPPAAIAKAD